MKLAVIPARGGSKRIPRKNMKDFCGQPMIAWSINVARDSGLFDKIIVSTDDPEIAEISTRLGAEVPFMRPQALSDDFVGTTSVTRHATNWALDQGMELDAVCCIYATAVFLQVADLARGHDLFISGDWEFAFSATDYAASVFRSFGLTDNGGVQMYYPEHFNSRSQDLPIAMHDAGQFYWGRPQAWVEELRIFESYSLPVVIPRWRVQDIDTEDDWKRAEIIAPVILGLSE